MAIRKVYFIENNKVVDKEYDIDWHAGFSLSQKEKNVYELHNLIKKNLNTDLEKILEVSTKSKSELGKRLSSFNLFFKYNGTKYNMESAYQSSKVFRTIWGVKQFDELIKSHPNESRKIVKEENHSNLICFRFLDREFSLVPKFLFYDWLYIFAVSQIPGLYDSISNYKYFTDIEFNPKKSQNCQARSLVLYIWLVRNMKLEDYLSEPKKYYTNIT